MSAMMSLIIRDERQRVKKMSTWREQMLVLSETARLTNIRHGHSRVRELRDLLFIITMPETSRRIVTSMFSRRAIQFDVGTDDI